MTDQTIEIPVTGMTCDHCAATIEKALTALPGVKARVSYPKATATIESLGRTALPEIVQAIQAAGYGASLPYRASVPITKEGLRDGPHVAIIGSGSAAFACAIRAVERGGARDHD